MIIDLYLWNAMKSSKLLSTGGEVSTNDGFGGLTHTNNFMKNVPMFCLYGAVHSNQSPIIVAYDYLIIDLISC